MPRRLPDSMSWHVSGPAVRAQAARLARSVGRSEASGTDAPRPATEPSARARLVGRRRRRLSILAGVVVLSALLAVLGALPFLLQVLLDLVLVAYLVHLRTEARRAAELTDRRPGAAGRPAGRPARRPAPARPPAAGPLEVEPTAEEAELAPAVGGSEWSPVPVPPPSYVTKSQVGSPDAPQPMVDLTRAGSNLMDELGLWDDLKDDDTQEFALFFDDEDVPRRRAVND
jgi:hypothetical protein